MLQVQPLSQRPHNEPPRADEGDAIVDENEADFAPRRSRFGRFDDVFD